ncbi:FIST C-terminal domain-containing protein [Synergistaceae bacterium OttesenSCG-928-D05]|nr:FIST C-terminal domain-containing protein [Synergistaceae bacterium OttesenSCG-928-D05]
MIKMTTAYTMEVYDAEAAKRDILGQLARGALPAHSVGLVFCNLEFIENGVLEAVCAALPFETIGCTTQGAAVRGAAGHIMLTVTVLSSAAAAFFTAITEPLAGDPAACIAAAYRNAAAKLDGTPSMLFAFQPYVQDIRGDTVLQALDAASGGVPVFGTIALDFTTTFRTPMTILNGAAYGDRLPLLLLSSAAKPLFFAESLPEGRATISQHDVVTGARDNILTSVNNAPAYDYMEKLGLAEDGAFNGAQLSLPVLLDYQDGEKPKACSFYDITPEGFVRCGGDIPVGATFSIASLGHSDVVSTAAHLASEALALAEGEYGGVILFSCFSRNIVLADRSAEMEAVNAAMPGGTAPYSFIYSGGELCPMYDDAGKTVNRFHNYSLIGCLL